MKIFKLFLFYSILLFFILACNNKPGNESINLLSNSIDTLNIGCCSKYEINFQGNGDTINKTFGKANIKHGHWITYEMVASNQKQKVDTVKKNTIHFVHIKIEEGFYKYNKKNGFWKFYNKDGSFKDSIEYKNDIAIN